MAQPLVEVHTQDGIDLSEAMVVVGAPTLGLVGTITTRYLVERLDLALVGGLRSPRFPPVSIIHEGRPSLPIRLYHLPARCGAELECQRLIVVTAEFMPGVELIHGMTEALIEWALAQEAQAMLVPDGLVVQDTEQTGQEIRGVAALDSGMELLAKLDVEPVPEGMISGLSASLLYDSERLGLNTLCLLAESHPDHPDARAAARVVEIFDRLIPDIDISTTPLLEEAEAIENQVRSLRQQLAEKASEAQDGAEPAMYH